MSKEELIEKIEEISELDSEQYTDRECLDMIYDIIEKDKIESRNSLVDTYNKLDNDAIMHFNSLCNKLKNICSINKQFVYIDYLNQKTGRYYEATVISIDKDGVIIVNDHDTGEHIETDIYDYTVIDKLILLELIK